MLLASAVADCTFAIENRYISSDQNCRGKVPDEWFLKLVDPLQQNNELRGNNLIH
jgi:hypothetical protein